METGALAPPAQITIGDGTTDRELQRPTTSGRVDEVLLRRFEEEILSRMPHTEEGEVVNPTPLRDITAALKEGAASAYGLDLSGAEFRVFGKFEAEMLGGSIKARPAVRILDDAIRSGRLRRGQAVFEVTSGNFGIALGPLTGMGVDVIALVSSTLKERTVERLRRAGVKTVEIDLDLRRGPSTAEDDPNVVAKAVASRIRPRLQEFGLDPAVLDSSMMEVEGRLALRDVIGLSKLLARGYGGFCPEQYDNELNVAAHERGTAPEIDGQLREFGLSLADVEVACTFGTGGTAGGLCRYLGRRYGRRSVHVVFPLGGQDVGGIRAREAARGLKFYEPGLYGGLHEADFREARPLMRFMAAKGHDVGESSALALYAALQMVSHGAKGDYVVLLPDGIEKYVGSLERGQDA